MSGHRSAATGDALRHIATHFTVLLPEKISLVPGLFRPPIVDQI